MAELKYDKSGRLLFTREMKSSYKILVPMMLPIHFTMIVNSMRRQGYDVELLKTSGPEIVEEGLKVVHNDTCYPALLVIGQMVSALKSGNYDPDKTALMITQTGGGRRASNYIHLLRKALKGVGMEKIPVISLNLSGLEKNPGFKLSFGLLREFIYSIVYGDLIMLLHNRCRSYEITKGSADRVRDKWVDILNEEYKSSKNMSYKHVKANFGRIAADFAKLELEQTERVRVGVVGEIFVKYAPLGNNNLEDFLLSEGAEVVVPGLLDFVTFKVDNRAEDVMLYGGKLVKKIACDYMIRLTESVKGDMIAAVSKYPQFEAPKSFAHLKTMVKEYMGYGNKMGEGWLLTAEMLELIDTGTPNIVCTQPFGCLPNHIVGKGMIRAIKNNHPNSNIVAIDYDPGATRVNQENRIRLMLANARMNMEDEKAKAAEL